ncbi:unnamed protein product, partial [Heterosigma akashiwo]
GGATRRPRTSPPPLWRAGGTRCSTASARPSSTYCASTGPCSRPTRKQRRLERRTPRRSTSTRPSWRGWWPARCARCGGAWRRWRGSSRGWRAAWASSTTT